jgi:hypothetical protein
MLGVESREEFELVKKDENFEVEAVDAKVSERVEGMVKKLPWSVGGHMCVCIPYSPISNVDYSPIIRNIGFNDGNFISEPGV